MAKTILFFADGTWNGPGRDESDNKKGDQTNVFKTFANLEGKDSAGDMRSANEQERILVGEDGEVQQIAKYLHGVGDSDNFLVRVLGGTIGAGLITRLLRGHTFISRNYQREDKLFIVGFSRGAYTARSLAAFIAARGLLDASKEDLSDKETAYRLSAALWYDYRKNALRQNNRQDWLGKLEETVLDLPRFVSARPTQNVILDCKITAVAVFDTVGSLGIPEYALHLEERIDALQFCDTSLSTSVVNGIHAVSLDEQRIDFTPTLWVPRNGVKQVLFPGAHADVGGGYPAAESELSDSPLQWMASELSALQVKFAENPIYTPKPNAIGTAHQPWAYPPFNVTRRVYRAFANGFPVHSSVQARVDCPAVAPDPAAPRARYNPPNMPGTTPPVIQWP